MVPIYLDHIPSGSSTRPFVHYAQLSLLNREFKKYDFGNADENIEHYGVPVPPNHDLTNVKVNFISWENFSKMYDLVILMILIILFI